VRAALEDYATYQPSEQEYYDTEVKPLVLTLFDKNTNVGDKVQVKVYAVKQDEDLSEGGTGPAVEVFTFEIDQFPFEIAS
jgi:hypothetical protein